MESVQNEQKRFSGKRLSADIFKIVLAALTVLLIMLLMFGPSLSFDADKGWDKHKEILLQIEQNEDLAEKYLKNGQEDLRNTDRTFTEIIDEIELNYSDENSGMGFIEFGLLIFRYTFSNGKVLASSGSLMITLFIAIVLFCLTCFSIPYFVVMFYKLVSIFNPNLKNSAVDTVAKIGGVFVLIGLFVLTIPFLMANNISIVAWHPLYFHFISFFSFTPLFYSVIAISVCMLAVVLILQCIYRFILRDRF